jgi:hypothetical protein
MPGQPPPRLTTHSSRLNQWELWFTKIAYAGGVAYLKHGINVPNRAVFRKRYVDVR